MPATFTIGECVRFGWKTFWSRPGLFIGAFVLVTLADIIVRWVANVLGAHPDVFGVVGGIVSVVVMIGGSALVSMAGVSFSLHAHDAPLNVTLADLKPRLDRFWHYLGVMILGTIAVVLGLVLLIIPGLFVIASFAFMYYVVIEKNLGSVAAIKESIRITKGHRLRILGLFLTFVLLNILGAIAILVGLLVTIPVTTFAIVHAYRLLGGGQETLPLVQAE